VLGRTRSLHRVAVSSMRSLAAKREMHTARGSCDRSDIRYYGHPTRRVKFQENISSALRVDASVARPLLPLQVIIRSLVRMSRQSGDSVAKRREYGISRRLRLGITAAFPVIHQNASPRSKPARADNSPSSYRINKVSSREAKRELHELGGEGWEEDEISFGNY